MDLLAPFLRIVVIIWVAFVVTRVGDIIQRKEE